MPFKDPKKRKEYQKKWEKANREKTNESRRRLYKANPEKYNASHKRWIKANPEKYREVIKKSYRKHIEKRRESFKKWYEANIEYSKARSRKYTQTHPRAQTEIMTEYRRSHRMCEWSDCGQSNSLHVHHILPLSKYPEHIDEKWNFICYCPFHHFAYHYVFSENRNDKSIGNALIMLWDRTEKWALKNKLTIEDLEIELAQMISTQLITRKRIRLINNRG